jgi:hypothetical protein
MLAAALLGSFGWLSEELQSGVQQPKAAALQTCFQLAQAVWVFTAWLQVSELLGCCQSELLALLPPALQAAAACAPQLHLQQRALHVFSESQRVLHFKQVCEDSNLSDGAKLSRLGSLMDASHASCAGLYECSCPELDALVGVARGAGALGARLTGGGGGSRGRQGQQVQARATGNRLSGSWSWETVSMLQIFQGGCFCPAVSCTAVSSAGGIPVCTNLKCSCSCCSYASQGAFTANAFIAVSLFKRCYHNGHAAQQPAAARLARQDCRAPHGQLFVCWSHTVQTMPLHH